MVDMYGARKSKGLRRSDKKYKISWNSVNKFEKSKSKKLSKVVKSKDGYDIVIATRSFLYKNHLAKDLQYDAYVKSKTAYKNGCMYCPFYLCNHKRYNGAISFMLFNRRKNNLIGSLPKQIALMISKLIRIGDESDFDDYHRFRHEYSCMLGYDTYLRMNGTKESHSSSDEDESSSED